MLPQAVDFLDESDALHELVRNFSDRDFERPTLFKAWTINDILAHLHLGNILADLALTDEDKFYRFRGDVQRIRDAGATYTEATDQKLDGLRGAALRITWRERYHAVAENFAAADPKARVKWVGPDMSVRSCISARLMETWSHGQAIYDLSGVERTDTDRIRNIVVLGINTFGWTFANRDEKPPSEKPYVCLTAPSGATWQWNDPSQVNRIDGSAAEFCQVVTQTRNIADTALVTRGESAGRWMAVAQCFAGPPRDPPAPGTRHKAR